MSPLSFSDISLTRKQIKMLKKISKGYEISYSKIKSEQYSPLEFYFLVSYYRGKYQITEKGKSYLRFIHKEFKSTVSIGIKYVITTLIALGMLVLALYNVIK